MTPLDGGCALLRSRPLLPMLIYNSVQNFAMILSWNRCLGFPLQLLESNVFSPSPFERPITFLVRERATFSQIVLTQSSQCFPLAGLPFGTGQCILIEHVEIDVEIPLTLPLI
jgi:hypothetical protein